MRISTTQIYQQGIEAFGVQQAKLAKLQQQISSGVRISKPSDDPAASARILELEQSIALTSQYQVNITLAENHVQLEETTLAAIENITFRLKELAIQGNNGALDQPSRNAIGVEVESRLDELKSLANTRDVNGDYLFAGYQSNILPFSDGLTGSIEHVVFNGDQGQRSLQISESRQVAVNDAGDEVFLKIPSSTALNERAAAANTGIASMAPAHVFDASVYVPGNFEIRFTAPGVYDVFDVINAVNIVTGAIYTDSADIEFQGIQTSISGAPAAGDVFSISQGQYRDVFEAVQTFTDTMLTSNSVAQREANSAGFLTDLDNFLTGVLDIRTSIGGRLNSLQSQQESNGSNIVVTKTTLSTLRDTDLAEAISQLTLEQTTLDAAQAVFARITSSSLFNFLR